MCSSCLILARLPGDFLVPPDQKKVPRPPKRSLEEGKQTTTHGLVAPLLTDTHPYGHPSLSCSKFSYGQSPKGIQISATYYRRCQVTLVFDILHLPRPTNE